MITGGRCGKMPCESCAVQFSVFKRKRVCCECERYYCSGCLRRGGGTMCAPCRVLSTRPLFRNTIAHLKVRDLQCFLQRQNVSTRGCVEKDELVNLCVLHVNGASYRRRGARNVGAFTSLKGFTTNFNDFLYNAFDLRSAAAPAPPPPPSQSSDCFNSSHAHRPSAPPAGSAPAPPTSQPQSERFTTTPGGERGISVEAPAAAGVGVGVARSPSAGSARVDSADCFEIEDLDDAGWEFVTRPADPLPNDSDILISAADALRRDSNPHEQSQVESRQAADVSHPADSRLSSESRHSTQDDFERIPDSQPRNSRPTISNDYLTPGLPGAGAGGGAGGGAGAGAGLWGARAASELELRSAASAASGAGPADTGDSASLQDELDHQHSAPATPRHVTLDEMQSPSELERLTVKQLKELLTRNRVEYRGCIERRDLLERAKLLWRDHAAYRAELDSLPIEECCKICMAAPLECVLLECGHIAACTACSKQLAECPICRQYVVRAVRFFRS